MSEEMENGVPELSLEGDELSPEEAASPVARAVHAETSGLRRRTYLAAAALGSAAAQLIGGGNWTVFAHTDDKSACTAGDIEVTGGEIINEPCIEGTPYTPIAKFFVSNKNNSSRNCITLHLGAGPSGLGGKDFLLTTHTSGDWTLGGSSNISGFTENQEMYASLGLQLKAGDFHDKLCFPNSVIAFRTARNQSDTSCDGPLVKYPGGQCRRQDICIIPFAADLKCVGSDCSTEKTDCTVKCGEKLYLLASATGRSVDSTSNGNYTFKLYEPNNATPIFTRTNVPSPQCFEVPNPKTGTYKIEAYDQTGTCFRTDTQAVTVDQIATPTIALDSGPDCEGNATVKVTNCDAALTYTWKVNGTAVQGVTGCTLTQKFAAGTNSVTVTASTGDTACDQTSSAVSVVVNDPVDTSLAKQSDSGCGGVVVFKASATGGNGSYTFEWKFDGSTTLPSNVSASGDTLTVKPKLNADGSLDMSCHTIAVTATDTSANKCKGDTATMNISQCISSTVGNGACA